MRCTRIKAFHLKMELTRSPHLSLSIFTKASFNFSYVILFNEKKRPLLSLSSNTLVYSSLPISLLYE